MNIYEKIQKARIALQEAGLKKTGKNKYAGYNYYELDDILPEINRIFEKIGLVGLTNFDEHEASLTIINTDTPEERVIFKSLQGTADLKGCHSIQNQGAVMTYQRRYLYIIAMEITEPETLDKTHQKENKKEEQKDNNPQYSISMADKFLKTIYSGIYPQIDDDFIVMVATEIDSYLKNKKIEICDFMQGKLYFENFAKFCETTTGILLPTIIKKKAIDVHEIKKEIAEKLEELKKGDNNV